MTGKQGGKRGEDDRRKEDGKENDNEREKGRGRK